MGRGRFRVGQGDFPQARYHWVKARVFVVLYRLQPALTFTDKDKEILVCPARSGESFSRAEGPPLPPQPLRLLLWPPGVGTASRRGARSHKTRSFCIEASHEELIHVVEALKATVHETKGQPTN